MGSNDSRAPRAGGDGVFISWVEHARASGLAAGLGTQLYVPARALSRGPWVLRYLAQGALSVWYLLRNRPSYVIFTNPPFVAGLPLLLVAKRLGIAVWCDAHSGVFNDQRWGRFARANLFVMNRCGGVVLHNHGLAEEVATSITSRQVVVGSPPLRERPRSKPATPQIVAPLGWEFDEPIGELLDAARIVPEISVALTGRPPEQHDLRVPPNCTLTGWLTDDEYDELLRSASAVICLTERENTMQTGAYEAIEHATPLIMSGTGALRAYCDSGGVEFVDDHRPETLAHAMRKIVSEQDDYRRTALQARPRLVRRSHDQLAELVAAIADSVTAARLRTPRRRP